MNMKLTIDKNKVFTENIKDSDGWVDFARQVPGEHYALLCYLSTKFNDSTILDLGTWAGWSAVSLAQNPTNTVITYDIVDELPRSQNGICIQDKFYTYSNIQRKMIDARKELPEIIKSAALIILDIDPHDGVQETDFTNYLDKIGYEGFVVCDDIHLNDGMVNWWNSIKLPKHDLTDVAHNNAGAGTGLICYGKAQATVIELSDKN
jgi:predicted O-methyltransferase YrrM